MQKRAGGGGDARPVTVKKMCSPFPQNPADERRDVLRQKEEMASRRCTGHGVDFLTEKTSEKRRSSAGDDGRVCVSGLLCAMASTMLSKDAQETRIPRIARSRRRRRRRASAAKDRMPGLAVRVSASSSPSRLLIPSDSSCHLVDRLSLLQFCSPVTLLCLPSTLPPTPQRHTYVHSQRQSDTREHSFDPHFSLCRFLTQSVRRRHTTRDKLFVHDQDLFSLLSPASSVRRLLSY